MITQQFQLDGEAYFVYQDTLCFWFCLCHWSIMLCLPHARFELWLRFLSLTYLCCECLLVFDHRFIGKIADIPNVVHRGNRISQLWWLTEYEHFNYAMDERVLGMIMVCECCWDNTNLRTMKKH